MVTIQHATKAHLPQILNIYNDVIINTTAIYDYHPHTAEMMELWFNTKQQDGFPIFAAIENEKVLGFCSFGPFRKWAAYKYSVENSVYVSKDARGKGVGKLLMATLIEAAREQQKHCIIAGIDASNEASIALHKTFGFVEVAHFPQVGYKFGRWLDLKFLQLVLDTPQEPVEG